MVVGKTTGFLPFTAEIYALQNTFFQYNLEE